MCRCAGFESSVPMNQLRAGMHETLASHTLPGSSKGRLPEPGSARIPDGLVRRLVSRIVTGDRAREAIPVRTPFTGEALAEIPRCTVDDVDEAMRRARRAQVEWSGRSHAARRGIFLRFHDLLLKRQEEVLDLVQLEAGKARRHAFEEVMDTAVVTRHYAYRAAHHLRPRRRRGALPLLTSTREYRHPVGVVACIVPWNYPLNLGITDAVAALLAGNAVVLKPDHQTSLTALWAVDLLIEAGLPPEVLPVITGEGPALGPALLRHADFVMFTGSTATGRVIAQQAAERLIGVSLELGGKNPMLVLADADLDRAVEGALRGCFVGAGQVCVSLERIYVHRDLFDGFAAALAAAAGKLRLGAGLDYRAEMGSLTSERQLRTVGEHVADALAKGATLLCGGRARPDLGPLFYEPTVLTDVTPEMRVYAEETFGPVVSLYRCDSDEDAVRLANETAYGLSASVWSRDRRRAIAVARQVRAGTVNVNEAYAATWGSTHAPIGGMKESGLGRRHGAEGILKYTEAQTIAVQRFLPIAPPPGVSQDRYARTMTRVLRWMRRVPGIR
jgi:succinate-semialdehyde dehydrogenase / glutarate-semialdehyde dehydrogenase